MTTEKLIGSVSTILHGLRPRAYLLLASIVFAVIGIMMHALVLYEAVPAISITAVAGPESLPISQLWRASGDRTTPLGRHVNLLDEIITERGVQEQYVSRAVSLFWLTALSISGALYYACRYLSFCGFFDTLARYLLTITVPSAAVMILIYQPNPQVVFLNWMALHPTQCTRAPLTPLPSP